MRYSFFNGWEQIGPRCQELKNVTDAVLGLPRGDGFYQNSVQVVPMETLDLMLCSEVMLHIHCAIVSAIKGDCLCTSS